MIRGLEWLTKHFGGLTWRQAGRNPSFFTWEKKTSFPTAGLGQLEPLADALFSSPSASRIRSWALMFSASSLLAASAYLTARLASPLAKASRPLSTEMSEHFPPAPARESETCAASLSPPASRLAEAGGACKSETVG